MFEDKFEKMADAIFSKSIYNELIGVYRDMMFLGAK
jgi:hypothetical protein